MAQNKLSLVCASAILSSARRSAVLPGLTKKSISLRTEALQKGPRPRQTSIRRGNSDSTWSSDVGHYFENCFEKKVKNKFYKTGPSRPGFFSLGAFQQWSQNCCGPSVFSGIKLCNYTGGPIQLYRPCTIRYIGVSNALCFCL